MTSSVIFLCRGEPLEWNRGKQTFNSEGGIWPGASGLWVVTCCVSGENITWPYLWRGGRLIRTWGTPLPSIRLRLWTRLLPRSLRSFRFTCTVCDIRENKWTLSRKGYWFGREMGGGVLVHELLPFWICAFSKPHPVNSAPLVIYFFVNQ